MESLNEFIDEQDTHLHKLYPSLTDQEKWAYAKMLKLTEEVGELSEAILGSFSLQRKSKSIAVDVEGEIADVIITTLLLAKIMNIDYNQALQEKMQKIVARRETD